MGEAEQIEYLFTVSPDDLAPFYEAEKARQFQVAGASICILFGVAFLSYLISNSVKRFEVLFSILGGLTLVMGVGMLISLIFQKREKPPVFESYKAMVVASSEGVARFTSSTRVMYGWNLVDKIYADDFGLHIAVGGSEFFVPRSAFSSKETLSQESERLASFKAMVEAGQIHVAESDGAAPSTLH